MIQIYVTDSSPLSEELFLKEIYDNLSKERKVKADKCKLPLKKQQSVAAGWLLKEALHRFEGTCYRPFFNLSHSGKLAVCVVGDCEVGVDVELVAPIKENLIEACCTASELALLQQFPEKKEELFTAFWTKKESAAKLTHEGLSRILKRKNKEEEENIHTKTFRLDKEEGVYYLTVAAFRKELPEEYIELSLNKSKKMESVETYT